MRIPRVHDDQRLTPGQELELSPGPAQHLGRVLRMQPGQQIRIFDGRGHECLATLVQADKRRVVARLDQALPATTESPLQVHIGQCLSRGDRMDYAVQKATELGMASMTPLFSERCEVKLKGERQDKRTQHWQQVAVSACEQSYRAVIPEIAPPQPLSQWLQGVQADLKLVLHHRTPRPLRDLPAPGSIALLIGPEGGLTPDEISEAEAAGFTSIALGPRVLRTETAPVAALSLLHYLWGDLG